MKLFKSLFQKKGQGGGPGTELMEQGNKLDTHGLVVDRMIEKELGGVIPREEWVELESSASEWRFIPRLLHQFEAKQSGEFATDVYEDLAVRLGRAIRHSKGKRSNEYWKSVEEILTELAESLLATSRDRVAERRLHGCGIILELLGPVSEEAQTLIKKIPPPSDILQEQSSTTMRGKIMAAP